MSVRRIILLFSLLNFSAFSAFAGQLIPFEPLLVKGNFFSPSQHYLALPPDQPGPFAVGVRTLVLTDRSRFELWGLMFRTFFLEVWYPALDQGEPNTIEHMIGELPEWALAILKAVYGDYYDQLRQVATGAKRDAPLDPAGGPYAVIIFSHGHQAIRFQNFTLCEHLASHGFIVVAPDHYANAIFTNTPSRPILTNPIYFSLDDRLLDVEFIYQELLRLNQKEGDFLYHQMDLSLVGIAGHSLGGMTALYAGPEFPFIRAIAPLNPIIDRPFPDDFDKPFFLLQGAQDGICASYNDSNDRVYDEFIDAASRLKVHIELKNGGHYSATNACLLFPPSLYQTSPDCSDERIPVQLANQILCGYLTAFFKFALFEDQESGQYLQTNHFPLDIGYYYKNTN